MRIFDELGDRVEEAWRRVDQDEVAFPALAAAALREARLERELSGADVARWVLEAPRIPKQDDLGAVFGDPPVAVYQGARFSIQVLLWHEGRTSIHRHGFSGAFMVLDGSSLQVRYAFDVRRRVSSRMLLGDLRTLSAELLSRGAVAEIRGALLHAVFHLETPAATVVIRTSHEAENQPQYDYRAPFLCFDPFYSEPQATRQIQVLRFLWSTRRAEATALAAELIARSDLHLCWQVLVEAQRAPGWATHTPLLVETARLRHGAAADELAAVLHEDRRRHALADVRWSVKDPEHRFFLALLQNLPRRRYIEAMMRQRYPGEDPRARILASLEALSGVERIGVDLRDELNRQIVGALLDGRTPEGLLEALAEVFEPEEVHARKDDLGRHCRRLEATALAPLFR